MPEAHVDANNAGTSSQPAGIPTDANPVAASSPVAANTPTDVAKESAPTLQDVIGKAVGDAGNSTDPSTAAPAATTDPQVGVPQTPEQIAEAEAKQKDDVPFHDHPRWKEVISERNSALQEVEGYKARTEAAEAVVNDLSGYLRETNMQREEFDQTLDAARKFKAGDMQGFLAQVLPLVQQAQMFTGEFFTPEIQAKLDSGLIDHESAKMLVANQAKATFAQQQLDLQNQRTQEQLDAARNELQTKQQQEVLQRTESEFRSAHETWIASNRATDPGFVGLERAILAEAMLIRNANPAAITGPQVWTHVLEQAKHAVITREQAIQRPAARAITPITSSGNLAPNGVVATMPKANDLRARLEQVIGGSVG